MKKGIFNERHYASNIHEDMQAICEPLLAQINIKHFENFKFHFTQKADQLMSAAAKDKLILPYHMRANFGGFKQRDSLPKHYYLGGEFSNIYLTRQEVYALKHLAHGETMKEAGGLAGLSPRTIENYLNNVRTKMGLNKRHEIIKVVSKYIIL